MSQPKHITALDLKPTPDADLSPNLQKYFTVCREKLGLLPNVLAAYSNHPEQLEAFSNFYNVLMLAESGLSKLEREMIAVVVSSSNECFYCLTAHGAAVRQYSNDPALGELMVMNYRVAELSERQRAMLDFAHKMTVSPQEMNDDDRQGLRDVGFSDKDIWDIANIAGFFNMTNRVASAVDMQPNSEYHSMAR
ncbi:MAG: peroxidase-related enzyme [Gammaproteobacteria bacterium]